MNILALDTSTEVLSLALLAQGKLYTHQQTAGAMASQLVLPQIQLLLNQANLPLNALHGIAFGAGPGAFTGVRVACGVAQGLAFGANLPVVGINTLHAVAQASGADKVLVCLDARMGEIYHAALIREAAGWHEYSATTVCKPAQAPAVTEAGWLGAGSGWGVHEAELRQVYAGYLTAIAPQFLPSAEAILQLAEPVFAAGKAVPASEAMPMYVRNRVAFTTQERAQGLR